MIEGLTRWLVVLAGAATAPTARLFVAGSDPAPERVLLVSLQLMAFVAVGLSLLLAVGRAGDRSAWSAPSWARRLSGRGPLEAFSAISVYLLSAGACALAASVAGAFEAWQGGALLLSAGLGMALGVMAFHRMGSAR